MKRTTLPSLLACLLTLSAVAGPAPAQVPLEEAISALTEKLEAAPRDAALLNDYANLLIRAENYDAARAAYGSALEVEPDSLTALYNLGLLELEFGRIRAAGRLFKRALDLDEDFARGHYGMGMVLAARERHPRAVKHFSRAFILEPELLDFKSNPEILFNRLATWASMRSYLSTSPQRGTRLYNDPAPIVGLLVPALDLLDPAGEELPEGAEAEAAQPEAARPAENATNAAGDG